MPDSTQPDFIDDLRTAWAPLLQDADVYSFTYCFSGQLVIDRGTRLERMSVDLSEDLRASLTTALGDSKSFQRELTPSSVLTVTRDTDGVLLAHLRKTTFEVPSFARLIEQGFLTQEQALTVMQSVQHGFDVVIVGPHQVGRHILLQALVHETRSLCRTHVLDGLVAEDNADEQLEHVLDSIQHAARYGVGRVVASEIAVPFLMALADEYPELPLLVSLRASALPTVQKRLDNHTERLILVLVGSMPQGAPYVASIVKPGVVRNVPFGLEMSEGIEPARATSIIPSSPATEHEVAPPSPPMASQGFFEADEAAYHQDLPPLRPLPPGPPEGWGDGSPADPGWELDSGFAEVLESVANRPKFQPPPPPVHPQTQSLKEKPLAGISLEPPPDFTPSSTASMASPDSNDEPRS